MKTYLEPGDPGSFTDHPLQDIPEGRTVCPKCQGHGGWNSSLNDYPLPPGYEDTPDNRHRYRHFRSSCGACWGWGYLQKGQTCAHEWVVGRSVGRCLHEWTCKLCGATREVDSSD